MVRLRIVLVEPLYGGNVGHVARVLANFGQSDLVIVKGPEWDEEAYDRAVHAKPLLEGARRVERLEAALEGAHLVVATSRRLSVSQGHHLRKPLLLPELPERLAPLAPDAVVALLFGREDSGLTNDEVRGADLLCTIPTDDGYASMNLSHAVAVVLYELTSRHAAIELGPQGAPAEPFERAILQERFRELLDASNFPEHKRDQLADLWRSLMGRTHLTKWEFHNLIGVLTHTLWHFGRRYANYGDGRDVVQGLVPAESRLAADSPARQGPRKAAERVAGAGHEHEARDEGRPRTVLSPARRRR